MRAAVIVFPGSNCDRDLAVALRAAGIETKMVWHKDTALPEGIDIVGVPGGFSFGDYLRCGAIAANSPICQAVKAHADRGGYVLGICNGFQILTETRHAAGRPAAQRGAEIHLPHRASGGRRPQDSVFTCGLFRRRGRSGADRASRRQLHRRCRTRCRALPAEDRIAFTYGDNPNGSVARHRRDPVGKPPGAGHDAASRAGRGSRSRRHRRKRLFAHLAETLATA